ncbi:hypothetical protein [Leptospira levettii]|uniref:hypothetical protein n=1 Tax=Leptospira levettii TaxID=2023178 RepID=UPI000C299278|nr:hypothetical protein [Leptospira levettii]PJZ87601.1 hypothetical protein CH368_15945 [Leptospira levettii]
MIESLFTYLPVGWEYFNKVVDLVYMVALFVFCLYLFKFSPLKNRFNENNKGDITLLVGVVLGALFVTAYYLENGLTGDLIIYHVRLLTSYGVTTSFHDHVASWLIRGIEKFFGKPNTPTDSKPIPPGEENEN